MYSSLTEEFATDIKDTNPDKNVTLLHSRDRLMPIYDKGLHDAILARCEALGLRVVLGERVLEWPENPGVGDGTRKVIKTSKGTELTGDLVLVCTGTKPTVSFMESIDKDTIAANGCIRVKDTMQIHTETGDNTYDHMFAVGDCADTTAIRAGHMSFAMGALSSRNILRLIEAREKDANAEVDLELYVPDAPRIKVTLGIKHYCVAAETTADSFDNNAEDIGARGMWTLPGAQNLGDDE
jgi:NADH dehydrogenase FAD-containing subunit